MATRIYSWNAYESELVSGVDASTSSIIVTSSVGLTDPCYLVIDPDDPAKREYIKVTAINAGTLTVSRGEDGSAGGTGVAHDANAKVRAVAVHQWLTDIYDDIIAIENSFTGHEGAADPHSVYLLESVAGTTYLKLSGGTMTGTLILDGNPTPGTLEAATAQYVNAAETAAKAHADSLDHDHATPIGVHAGDVDAHHPTGFANEAVAAVAAADPYVKNDGDTMTGFLTLHAAPTSNLHASTKKYVDDGLALKSGTSHTHSAYSPTSHTHSGVYSPTSHNHSGVYQPVGSYADASHAHSGYVLLSANTQTIDGELKVGPGVSGAQVRNVWHSSSAPTTQGSNGDLWLEY